MIRFLQKILIALLIGASVSSYAQPLHFNNLIDWNQAEMYGGCVYDNSTNSFFICGTRVTPMQNYAELFVDAISDTGITISHHILEGDTAKVYNDFYLYRYNNEFWLSYNTNIAHTRRHYLYIARYDSAFNYISKDSFTVFSAGNTIVRKLKHDKLGG